MLAAALAAALVCTASALPLAPGVPAARDDLFMSAFNIQIFGVNKMSDPAVVKVLLDTVSRYDLCLIQEVRDSSGTAIVDFVSMLNNRGDNEYQLFLQSRVGRSASKEQVAVVYDPKKVTIVAAYEDPDTKDVFERPPYVLLAEAAGKRFSIIGIHVAPLDADNEIAELVRVYNDSVVRHRTDDALIIGDLNADCSYFPDSRKANNILYNDPRMSWDIADDVDTMVNENTVCAYDRIISVNGARDWIDQPKPFLFDAAFDLSPEAALDVSDHYPVEVFIRA